MAGLCEAVPAIGACQPRTAIPEKALSLSDQLFVCPPTFAAAGFNVPAQNEIDRFRHRGHRTAQKLADAGLARRKSPE